MATLFRVDALRGFEGDTSSLAGRGLSICKGVNCTVVRRVGRDCNRGRLRVTDDSTTQSDVIVSSSSFEAPKVSFKVSEQLEAVPVDGETRVPDASLSALDPPFGLSFLVGENNPMPLSLGRTRLMRGDTTATRTRVKVFGRPTTRLPMTTPITNADWEKRDNKSSIIQRIYYTDTSTYTALAMQTTLCY